MVAWVTIIYKAIKVKIALNKLRRAKLNAFRQSEDLPPIHPIYERPFRFLWKKIKRVLSNACAPFCRSRNLFTNIFKKGSLSNELSKGMIGLTVGILFTKLLVDFMLAQLNFHSYLIIAVGVTFGVIVTAGLTVSDGARCLFVLGIPVFFSGKGRAALLAYILILAMSGPGKNTAKNLEIMTESLICGQEMVANSTENLITLAKHPYSALKTAMQSIKNAVIETMDRMSSELKATIKSITTTVDTIKYVYDLLKNIVSLCNAELGSAYDRCNQCFDEASEDCSKKLGVADALCYPVDVFKNFCHLAKLPAILLCWLPSLLKATIFSPLEEYFESFKAKVTKFFDVNTSYTYDFKHNVTPDKSFAEVSKKIRSDVLSRFEWISEYIDWTDFVVSFAMFIVVWKAYSYRGKFLKSDRFDNVYISRRLIIMDSNRAKHKKETIFPLRQRESMHYVQTFSWRMTEEEGRRKKLGLVLVGLAGIQIYSYVVLDYLLYLFLELIRKYGGIQLDTAEALGLTLSVEGEGFLAAMYRNILQGLNPEGGLLPSFDTTKCLPTPVPPNFFQYLWIVMLYVLCIFVTIMEPYGLRFRHVVCEWVYPERVVRRETWLYTHILSSRGSFIAYAKKQIHSKLRDEKSTFQISFVDRLAHTLPYLCGRFLISHKKKCFLCGRTGPENDTENFSGCKNCGTNYCLECYTDMHLSGKTCPACASEFGEGEESDYEIDLESDISEHDSESDLEGYFCGSSCCKKKGQGYMIHHDKTDATRSTPKRASSNNRENLLGASKAVGSVLKNTKESKKNSLPLHHHKKVKPKLFGSMKQQDKVKYSKLQNEPDSMEDLESSSEHLKKPKSTKSSKNTSTSTKNKQQPFKGDSSNNKRADFGATGGDRPKKRSPKLLPLNDRKTEKVRQPQREENERKWAPVMDAHAIRNYKSVLQEMKSLAPTKGNKK